MTLNALAVPYTEPYRPQFHYSPRANWINDPNGLVYYAGEYHLFYQYTPNSKKPAAMHWGHAVSTDLVHWNELPIALYPDSLGTIFSGSAVVDADNSSDLVPCGGLVACFTYYNQDNQTQGLAYSRDSGRTWDKYSRNPILQAQSKDFRDPKVFWYADSKRWIMVIGMGDHIGLFESKNLISWEFLSDFGAGHGAHGGVWECPDLFPMTVAGQTRWVLLISLAKAPAGGWGTQYFVGSFDGTRFTNENPPEQKLWLDYGSDNYACASWNNTPDGRRIIIGWMNDWRYSTRIPTDPWRGVLTVPRELELVRTADGVRLKQTPIRQLQKLRGPVQSWRDRIIAGRNNLLADIAEARAFEILAEFDLQTAKHVGFIVRMSADRSQYTTIAYDVTEHRLLVDRRFSGQEVRHNGFPDVHSVNFTPEANRLLLHILVDWSSVEVFASGGLIAITDQIFPDLASSGLELFVSGGEVCVLSLDVFPLRSIWHPEPHDEGK